MAFTPHGHQIEGTDVEERPVNVARCGGPRVCIKCANAIAAWWEDEAKRTDPRSVSLQLQELTHSQGTMFKVYDALKDVGLTKQQAIDAISSMQNNGIYFREAA